MPSATVEHHEIAASWRKVIISPTVKIRPSWVPSESRYGVSYVAGAGPPRFKDTVRENDQRRHTDFSLHQTLSTGEKERDLERNVNEGVSKERKMRCSVNYWLLEHQ